MRTTLLTYADRRYRSQQQRCVASGLQIGGFDRILALGPGSLDATFCIEHRLILEEARGAGLWLWKPQIIAEQLASMTSDDWLFYCDAGAEFVAPIQPLIAFAEREGRDVVVFELNHMERSWTKRDAFVLLGCDEPRYADTPQRLASYSLWRSTGRSRQLAAEWLFSAADRRLLSDDANVMGADNYAGFRDHRHDQSILSLLTKRYGFAAARDPSQYGSSAESRARFPSSSYPLTVLATRLYSRPRRQLLRLRHVWLPRAFGSERW